MFPNRPQLATGARRFYTTQACPAHWERVAVLASGHGSTWVTSQTATDHSASGNSTTQAWKVPTKHQAQVEASGC